MARWCAVDDEEEVARPSSFCATAGTSAKRFYAVDVLELNGTAYGASRCKVRKATLASVLRGRRPGVRRRRLPSGVRRKRTRGGDGANDTEASHYSTVYTNLLPSITTTSHMPCFQAVGPYARKFAARTGHSGASPYKLTTISRSSVCSLVQSAEIK